ncbi:MAG TPA: class A beta-lactamase [Catenuloplanes sp.]|jgi:beta-lactamase class A
MTAFERAISRRALLGAAGLLPLAGCTGQDRPAVAPTSGPAGSPTAAAASATASAASGAAASSEHHAELTTLERKFGRTLGVYALATGTKATIAHRADDRFAFCSTFKGLAVAAVLKGKPLSGLGQVIRYTSDDLMPSSKITELHVGTGMSIRDLCHAAVVHSDGTAGNLLLDLVGGPAGLTRYLRGLGDRVTRCDRREPNLTTAIPGDPRDTTTPRAIGGDYQRIVLGEALPSAKRDFLRDLLERANVSPASKGRIRAGVPKGWTVADKTGTGSYGTMNDIAIVWPAKSAPPLVIAIMARGTDQSVVGGDNEVIAAAARYVTATLT